LALQARDEIAEAAEEKDGDDHDGAEKPVRPPKARFHLPSRRTLGCARIHQYSRQNSVLTRILAVKPKLRQIFRRAAASLARNITKKRCGLKTENCAGLDLA